jgi:hypothetical protein
MLADSSVAIFFCFQRASRIESRQHSAAFSRRMHAYCIQNFGGAMCHFDEKTP